MTADTLPPPASSIGLLAWLRQNLFSSPLTGLVTLLLGAGIGWLLLVVAVRALKEARWSFVTNNQRL